ncbi:MAG: site-2 protease family protein [Planctomycetota bacterium]
MILLIAVVAAVIVLIIRNIETTKNILLVLLGFGAVILVHEFGHFVVAKLCGIKVEAFSIFMPPTLLGIKKADRGWRLRVLPEMFRKEDKQNGDGDEGLFSITIGKKILPGDTEYRIGLIPFGGFVKMLGQDDVGPVKENKDPRSFANKPALVRAAVLAAGVTFNVISAAIVYMIVFLVGVGLPAPIAGGVVPGSAAQQAGIRPGDEVIEIAGEDGRLDFSDVMMAGVLSGKDEAVPMKIRREDGTIENVKVVAGQLPGGKFREFGIERAYSLTIAKLFSEDANFLKKTIGLMPGDRVKAVEGVDVNSHWQFEQILQGTFEPNVVLLAQRHRSSGETQLVEGQLELSFTPTRQPWSQAADDLAQICGMVPRMRIEGLNEQDGIGRWLLGLFGLSDKKQKLEAGDIIVGLADANYPTYDEMRKLTKEYVGKPIDVTVIRSKSNGVQRRLTVVVNLPKEKDPNNVIIGIAPMLDVEHPVVARTIATPQRPEALAIPRGATITAVDGVDVSSFYDVTRELKKNAGQRITIDWRIDEQNAGDTAIEVGKDERIAEVQATPRQMVPFKQLERVYKAKGPIDAVIMGYKRTKIFIIQTYITLQRLIGGLLSPKELMGPVGILAFSYRIVADQPFIYYVYFLGLISASIAVLNFLPLPPLDGGLTLLLLVEKIKGSALSMRTQEIIAYAGWGFVGALLLYVTFNDIVRIIFG